MNRTLSRAWLIGRHHFLQEASKRTFLLVLFSLPLFLALIIGVGLFTSQFFEEFTTLGYVDPAGWLLQTTPESEDAEVRLIPYGTEEAAEAALEAGEIDAYYVLYSDFAASRRAELVYVESPPWRAQRFFADLLRRNLLADRPPQVRQRALEGPSLTIRATDAGREFPANGPPVSAFLPVVVAAVVGFLIMTTSGYLMEVVVTEKENRTMEIVVSSVSAGQMMLGKIIGALGIAFLQILVWSTCFAATLWLGGGVLQIGWLQSLQPNWGDMAQIVVVGIPVYLFMAALMTAIGATLVDSQDAQQAGPFYLLVLYVPFFFLASIANNPNGPVALILSFFPPTAITAFAVRMIFTSVPWWQAVISAAIAFLAGLAMIWLAGRVLRLSMLRYGQRLRLRDLWAGPRSSAMPLAGERRAP